MECTRENEVVEAVASGNWSERCYDELRTHASSCSVCKEVAEVAIALHDDYAEVLPQVRVPSAGLVWWRSELRARREAVRKAERPLTLVHAFAGACTIGVVAALLVQMYPMFAVTLQQHMALAIMLAALILIAPVALYFALSDK